MATSNLPTPQSRDWKGSSGRSYKGTEFDLPTAVKLKFPTPTASDYADRKPSQDIHITCNGLAKNISASGKLLQMRLSQMVKIPTPRASDAKGCGPVGSSSHSHMIEKDYLCAVVKTTVEPGSLLNPDWVEGVMGWPAGWTALKPLGKGLLSDFLQQRGASGWADYSWHSRYPSITQRFKFINDRIIAIGNGQVSITCATAFQLLLERLNQK